ASGGGAFAEQGEGEQGGEHRLDLEHQGGQPARHARVHADEEQPELGDPEGQAHADDPFPGHRGASHQEHRGERRHEEAQGGEQQGREVVEADLDDGEVDAPDGGDADGEQDVGGSHGSRIAAPHTSAPAKVSAWLDEASLTDRGAVMLDLQRLRALHAVSVHGTVGAAAVALGYTSSAVSQQIAKLERETRTVLLERRGRGVRLTDEARQLVAAAQELMAIVERAETELEERRGRPSGRLTIAAFASAARGLMPSVLADLARRHPALDTRLTEIDPHLSVDLVARGAVDRVGARDRDVAPLAAPAGVEQAVIGDDLCDLLVPRDHPFAARSAVRREELGGERWICPPPGRVCHEWLVRTLRADGHEPDIVHQADENPTLVALVAAGLGCALSPRLGRGPLPEEVVEVPLDPLPARRLYALWRSGAARRPAIAETVRALREHWPRVSAHTPR